MSIKTWKRDKIIGFIRRNERPPEYMAELEKAAIAVTRDSITVDTKSPVMQALYVKYRNAHRRGCCFDSGYPNRRAAAAASD